MRVDPEHAPSRAGHSLRFVLGMAQIAGVGLSLGLLVSSGLTPLALGAVMATCLVTAVSVLLFGSHRRP
jgi:hypothetical protein